MEGLNKDWKRRNEILGIEDDQDSPPDDIFVMHTPGRTMDLDTVELLLKEGFIDPEDNQNGSPDAIEFIEFMRDHPWARAIGYAVSIIRDDYRVTIDGLVVDGEDSTFERVGDFVAFCQGADELNVGENGMRAWWD